MAGARKRRSVAASKARSSAAAATPAPVQEQDPPPASSPPAGVPHPHGGGRVPNLLWGAVDADALRAHARMLALPPESAIALSGPGSYRFVRQGTPLWGELHAGVLTGAHIRGLLGLCEPRAAELLGLPACYAGRAPQREALEHLRAPRAPPAEAMRAGPAAAHNAKVVADYNRQVKQEWTAAGPGPGSAAAAAAAERAARGAARSQHAAARGIGAVRCAWGSAQEGRALWSLLDLRPRSTLAEVGLCMLDPSTLPRGPSAHPAWAGTERLVLPPMGASPDALIRHLEDPYRPLAPAVGGNLSCAPGDVGGVDAELEAALRSIAAAQRAAAAQAAGPAPAASHARGAGLAAGSDGASVVFEEVVEVKCTCPFMEPRRSYGGSRAPRYGLSSWGASLELPRQHVPQLQLEMLCSGTSSALLVLYAAGERRGVGEGAAPAPDGSDGEDGAVESPAGAAPRPPSRSRSRSPAGERGRPRRGMVRIFRLLRDDAYCASLLRFVSLLYTRYVLPADADYPPPDVLFGEAGYRGFVLDTARLAREAVLLEHVGPPDVPGVDTRAFLDPPAR